MNYEILLKEHALKVTPQRVGILSLMDKAGHISVEDLYTKISRQFPSISLATLYKNIHSMLKNDLIKEVKAANMKSKYELNKAPHAHLLCEECGEFKDFPLDINSLLENAVKQSHYKMHESSIIFSGICPACQKS